MTIAVMQPYFFPYIGYLQLIGAVNIFVIYDDVQYIKKGYINRNVILSNNEPYRFTLQLIGASQNKLISEIGVGNNAKKILKTISHSYTNAPYFKERYSIIEEIFLNRENILAKFVGHSLEVTSKYLGIKTKFIYSSSVEYNRNLKAQDKVIDICKKIKSKSYINSIGGKEIYNRDYFKNEGIKIHFLKPKITKYKQFHDEFVPYLSIIDVMMFNSKEEISIMLNNFDLI